MVRHREGGRARFLRLMWKIKRKIPKLLWKKNIGGFAVSHKIYFYAITSKTVGCWHRGRLTGPQKGTHSPI